MRIKQYRSPQFSEFTLNRSLYILIFDPLFVYLLSWSELGPISLPGGYIRHHR